MAPLLFREPEVLDLLARLESAGDDVQGAARRMWEPVRVLQSLHALAPAALRNDALAVVRIRALLRLEWPWSLFGKVLRNQKTGAAWQALVVAAFTLGGEDRTSGLALAEAVFGARASTLVADLPLPVASIDLLRPGGSSTLPSSRHGVPPKPKRRCVFSTPCSGWAWVWVPRRC